jgi:hypothetical protein
MEIPALSRDLIRNLDNLHTELDRERIGGLLRMPGNPFGIAIERFGGATAFAARGIPTTYYNKVLGLSGDDRHLLREIGNFFGRHGSATIKVEVLPGSLDADLADRLSSYGLRQTAFTAGYYGLPTVPPGSPSPDVSIQTIDKENDLDDFLGVFHEGFGMGSDTRERFIQSMRYWGSLPRWELVLARIEGVPASCGVIFVQDRVAYFALGTTTPRFRGRGALAALIHYAFARVRDRGCELVCGQCEFPSTTARHFERFGLRLAYHKAVWELRPRRAQPAVAESLY